MQSDEEKEARFKRLIDGIDQRTKLVEADVFCAGEIVSALVEVPVREVEIKVGNEIIVVDVDDLPVAHRPEHIGGRRRRGRIRRDFDFD
jgi:hypothetical protein